jgi:PhnB protein
MSHYAPDVVAFDAIARLQFRGVEAYDRHWRACMALCPGPMLFEIHDPQIAASGDVAFAHFLSRCGGQDEHGQMRASWMRGTECYRRVGEKWVIAHEHFSAPFDMASGKALFDLEP